MTIAEMQEKVPTFFNTLPEAKLHLYKNHLIVTILNPKSIGIYRYVPSGVRPKIDRVRGAKTLEEARAMIDSWIP